MYFYILFNEGYDISSDSSRLDIREEYWNYNYYCRIQKREVKKTLKMMSNSKVVMPKNIPIKVWKILGDRGIKWLTKLFNEIIRSKCMSDEWRRNTLVQSIRTKGIYKIVWIIGGLNLWPISWSHGKKMIERRLRKETQVTENQFGYIFRRSIMKAIYLLWQVMERYRMDQ